MTSDAKVLELLPMGLRWPSGDYIVVALLNLHEADISRSIGGELTCGEEPGLGPWQGIGVKLGSGAVVELITHSHQPTSGFELRVDRGCSLAAVFDETLAALGIGQEPVVWRSPHLGHPGPAPG
jgi:hypothetical protein